MAFEIQVLPWGQTQQCGRVKLVNWTPAFSLLMNGSSMAKLIKQTIKNLHRFASIQKAWLFTPIFHFV
jgi:tRNA A37 N6-isopentenylltransferase MiaA